MATCSGSLAFEIPRTEEPGGLQSIRVKKEKTQQLNKSMFYCLK